MAKEGKASAPENAEALASGTADKIKQAEEFLARYKVVCKLSEMTSLPRVQVAGGLGVVLVLLILLIFGSDGLCNMVGFFYPARQTIQLLRTSTALDDFKFWIHYWLVFGLFVTLEVLIDDLLLMIPLFFFLKMAFLVFCFLPQTKGATIVYNVVIDSSYYFLQKNLDNLTTKPE